MLIVPRRLAISTTGLPSRLNRPPATFSLEQALVHAMQLLFHRRSQQRVVLYLEQVVHDEPHRLVGRHPLLTVETLQVHRTGKASQRALAPQVAVDVEITKGQLSQS